MEPPTTVWYQALVFCIAFVTLGTEAQFMVFSMYSKAIKDTFDISQTHVDLIQGCHHMAMFLTPLSSLWVHMYGGKKVGSIIIVVASTCYLLIWSSTFSPEFYHRQPWLLMVFFFGTGVGTAPSYTAVSTCLASLLDDVSFARVMTALTVGFDLMPLVLMVVYSQLFNGDAPGLEQDFSGYMLFLTILYFTIHSSFYIVFHFRKFGTRDVGPLPTKDGCKQLDAGSKDQSDEDETITECKEPLLQNDFEVQFMSAETVAKVENGSTNKCCEDDKIKEYYKSLLENDSEVNFTCKEAVKNARFLLGSLRFHLLIWPCAIGLALRILFCGNVHVYMESFRMETYSHTLQYIYPMTSVSLKLLLSAYVSIQGKHAAMLEVFILSALVNLAAIVWSLFPQDNAGAMAMLIALWSTFGSIASGLSVVLLKEEFGTVLFPLYTGAPLCTFALVSFLLQLSFGSFYDMYRQDEAVCYGPQCFLWTFLIAGLLAAASIAALAILMCRRRNAKECDTL